MPHPGFRRLRSWHRCGTKRPLSSVCRRRSRRPSSTPGTTGDGGRQTETLLGYDQATDNVDMQALVITAVGDLCRVVGNLPKALHWYECAAVPAAQPNDALMLAAITKNLGELAYEGARYANADEYFDGL